MHVHNQAYYLVLLGDKLHTTIADDNKHKAYGRAKCIADELANQNTGVVVSIAQLRRECSAPPPQYMSVDLYLDQEG